MAQATVRIEIPTGAHLLRQSDGVYVRTTRVFQVDATPHKTRGMTMTYTFALRGTGYSVAAANVNRLNAE